MKLSEYLYEDEEYIDEQEWIDNAKRRAKIDVKMAIKTAESIINEERMLMEKKNNVQTLKDNKIKMSEEERKKAMDSGCVWHWNGPEKPVCAIWKTKDSKGKIYYCSNTHRAFAKSSTLKGAIKKFKFIKTTS